MGRDHPSHLETQTNFLSSKMKATIAASLLSKIEHRNHLYTTFVKGKSPPSSIDKTMKKLAYDITRTRRNLKKAYFSKKLDEAGTTPDRLGTSFMTLSANQER